MKQFGLVLLFAVVASAHLCLMNPPQRGDFPRDAKPGDPRCGLTTAPCGGKPSGEPLSQFKRGENIIVVVQKNLDHYNEDAPGNFTFYGSSSGGVSPLLAMLPDTNSPSLSLYYFNITVPEPTGLGTYTFMAQYTTNNPNAPAAFYSCADVAIVG